MQLPKEITQDLELNPDFTPCVCLVDDRQSFLGWAIKAHEKGNYNHIMTLISPNYFVTQAPNGYKICRIEEYKKKRFYLKFWQPLCLTKDDVIKWRGVIAEGLSAPWWKRKYDFLGIIGQLVNIKFIQNPFGKFCSERVRDELVKAFSFCYDMPKFPSPSECNEYFGDRPAYWVVKGTYRED